VLASEIASNLGGLDGIGEVTVEELQPPSR
jgi:hypothetical protein